MRTAEKQTPFADKNETSRSFEEAPAQGSGPLREKILSSPEMSGSWVYIPEGTIAVEMDSNTLAVEDMFAASDKVAELREDKIGSLRPKDGAQRLMVGEFIKGIDRKLERRNQDAEVPSNITALYDKTTNPADNELHIPSVVLVHEALTPEQIATLRETFPPGVPFVDAKTNKLLDEIGQKERNAERHTHKLKTGIGRTALFGEDQQGFNRLFEGMARSRSDRFFVGDSQGIRMENENDAKAYFYEYQGESSRSSANTGGNYTSWKTGWEGYHEPIPESDEVRSHRERTTKAEGMLDEAASKYGASSWRDLDAKNQERVRRQVMRNVHPDATGGDKELFQEVEFMTKDIARPRAESRAEEKRDTTEARTDTQPSEDEPSSDAKAPLELEAAERPSNSGENTTDE